METTNLQGVVSDIREELEHIGVDFGAIAAGVMKISRAAAEFSTTMEGSDLTPAQEAALKYLIESCTFALAHKPVRTAIKPQRFAAKVPEPQSPTVAEYRRVTPPSTDWPKRYVKSGSPDRMVANPAEADNAVADGFVLATP
jgi:hypothetical protein